MKRTENSGLKAQGELLTAIENKFLFVVSRYFWHIITTVAALAIVGGILCFLYSLTPVFKSSPAKGNYPEAEKVSKEELLSALETKNKPQSQKQAARKGTSSETMPADTAGLEKYSAALAELAGLVPDISTVQKNCLEYSYWSGCTSYALDTIDHVGNHFDKLKISDYGKRAQLVNMYVKIAGNYEKKNRSGAFNAALNTAAEDFSKYLADLTALYEADSVFKQNINLLKKNAALLAKNPNDGKPLLKYIVQSAPSFSDSVWQDFAFYMAESYSKKFGDFKTQKEYTDGFLPMAKEFEASQQISALKKYHELLGEKNIAREQKIKEIDSKYADDSANAKREYESKKSGQNDIRAKSAMVIGGAIVTIAFFALILVILSIQRNVVKLLDAQAKSEDFCQTPDSRDSPINPIKG